MHARRLALLATGALAAALLTAAPAEADADGCASGVADDFDGDGRADVVVGDSTATVDGRSEAGVIQIRYGSGSLVGSGAITVMRQQELGEGMPPQAGARYGFAIATADVDCDGYTDILAGAPNYDLSSTRKDAGVAQLLLGGPGGAGTGGTQVKTASQFGKSPAAGDQLGYAVDLLEDVGQGGTPAPDAYAMAIGVPGRDSAGKNGSGALATRTAVDGGSTYRWVDQESAGVPGSSVAGDRFGASVALGDIDGGDVDAVVGVPTKEVGKKKDAGTVVLLRGLYGDDLAGAKAYSQDSSGVPGSAEAGDRFGRAVDVVRSGSTTHGVVGIPNEAAGSKKDAGAVQLFTGGSSGITWGAGVSQDTAGVEGGSEKGDLFGSDVSLANGSPARLAVGVPGEDTTVADAGMVQLFRLDDLAADQTLGQDSTGIAGDPQKGDRFGAAVGYVRGPGELVLLVGAPHDVTYAKGAVAVVPVPSGTPRSWVSTYPGSLTFGDAIGTEGR